MGGTSPIMLTPLAQRPTKNLRRIVTVFLDGSTSDCCFLARWPWELILSSPGFLIRACSRALLASQPHQTKGAPPNTMSPALLTGVHEWGRPSILLWMNRVSLMNPPTETKTGQFHLVTKSRATQRRMQQPPPPPPPLAILKSLLSQYCTQWKYKGSPRSHETLQVIRLRQ